MATVISPTDRRVIIAGVSWGTYQRLLRDFGERHTARVAFDQGTLEIRAPSFTHERGHHLAPLVGEGFDLPRPTWLRRVRAWAESLPHAADDAPE